MSSLDRKPHLEEIVALPKALLHDHLDGGLRPQTIIDIAEEIGYEKLPTTDPEALADWFAESCNSGSLVRYLETFDHTIAVMQRREDLIRVARECVIDLARDGVVYAEVRGAPELFTSGGLSIDKVVEATLEGYKQGEEIAASEGHTIRVESILCALRQNHRDRDAAKAVVKYRDKGVVGFDIAGPEDGFLLRINYRPLNIYVERMLISQFMPVKPMDYLQFGRQFNIAVLNAWGTECALLMILISVALSQNWED